MEKELAVYIAKHRTRNEHYFFRVDRDRNFFPDGDLYHGIPEAKLPAFINELTEAKTHKQLVSAIEYASILLSDSYIAGHPGRRMTKRECLAEFKHHFEPVDPKMLAREMYMYAPKEIKANAGKSSPAASFDAYKTGFYDYLEKNAPGEQIVVESVRDWMCFRNLLSIGATLLANIETVPQDGKVLEASGFASPADGDFGPDVFSVPFKCGDTSIAAKIDDLIGFSRKDEDFDSGHLLWLLSEDSRNAARYEAWIESGLEGRFPQRKVFFALGSDGRSYLCVRCFESESQWSAAKRVVSFLMIKAFLLVDSNGSLLGAVRDDDGPFSSGKKGLSFRYKSLVSKCWDVLCTRENRRIVACKHCGSGILASNRGPVKEFCNDSCRTLYSGN